MLELGWLKIDCGKLRKLLLKTLDICMQPDFYFAAFIWWLIWTQASLHSSILRASLLCHAGPWSKWFEIMKAWWMGSALMVFLSKHMPMFTMCVLHVLLIDYKCLTAPKNLDVWHQPLLLGGRVCFMDGVWNLLVWRSCGIGGIRLWHDPISTLGTFGCLRQFARWKFSVMRMSVDLQAHDREFLIKWSDASCVC